MKEWVYLGGIFLFLAIFVFLLSSLLSTFQLPLTAAAAVSIGGIQISYMTIVASSFAAVVLLFIVLVRML